MHHLVNISSNKEGNAVNLAKRAMKRVNFARADFFSAEKEAHARQAVQEELEEVVARQKQELKSADMNLILQLDQIVADQQVKKIVIVGLVCKY